MRLLFNRRVLLIAGGVGVLLAIALWPKTIAVDVGSVTRGPLVVTIDDEGVTRVRNRFVVSAPVAGRVLRIELDPGDQVKKGTVVARLRAETPPLLDARSRAEAEAAIATARAVVGRARADEERARAALVQAQRELTRARELLKNELTSRQVVDAREAEERTARRSGERGDICGACRGVGSATSRGQAGANLTRPRGSCRHGDSAGRRRGAQTGAERASPSCRQAIHCSRSATRGDWRWCPICCRPMPCASSPARAR